MKKSWYLTERYNELTKAINDACDDWLDCVRKTTEMIVDGETKSRHFQFIEMLRNRAYNRMVYYHQQRDAEMAKYLSEE